MGAETRSKETREDDGAGPGDKKGLDLETISLVDGAGRQESQGCLFGPISQGKLRLWGQRDLGKAEGKRNRWSR